MPPPSFPSFPSLIHPHERILRGVQAIWATAVSQHAKGALVAGVVCFACLAGHVLLDGVGSPDGLCAAVTAAFGISGISGIISGLPLFPIILVTATGVAVTTLEKSTGMVPHARARAPTPTRTIRRSDPRRQRQRRSPSGEDDLRNATVAVLKQMLRAQGLRVSGNKPELIERLVAAIGEGGDRG